jgi:hypothetical protein
VTGGEGVEDIPVHGKASMWRGVTVDAAKHGKAAVVIGIKNPSGW